MQVPKRFFATLRAKVIPLSEKDRALLADIIDLWLEGEADTLRAMGDDHERTPDELEELMVSIVADADRLKRIRGQLIA